MAGGRVGHWCNHSEVDMTIRIDNYFEIIVAAAVFIALAMLAWCGLVSLVDRIGKKLKWW